MQSNNGAVVATLFCALGLAACAHTQHGVTDGASERARQKELVAILFAQASPDSLASAALLAPFAGLTSADALDLITRAVALAPERPELVWEARALCDRSKCTTAAEIEAHLRAIDPENGFAWLADLTRAQAAGSAADVTAAVARIGASARTTIYWNKVQVMLFDAMAAPDPSGRENRYERNVATRAVEAIGVLAAFIIPLRPLGHACTLPNLEESGRRAACGAMVALLEQSDTVLAQSYALSIQERWWPAGSSEREVVRAKRRRLDYVIAMSSQERLRLNHEMAIRIDAARRYTREEDVDIAVLKAHRIPLEPPPGWNDTWHQEFVPTGPAG